MPEPQEETQDSEEGKSSKILQFFSTAVKETKKEKVKPLTKVIIRRLPPRMTKEEFLEAFTLPAHDYFYFVRGDLFLGKHSFSRAYVNITNHEDIFAFKEKYDDHPLQDGQGREYHAVVEWAPVQRIPKKTSIKKSSKSGTIESDPKYVEFLEKLEQEKNNPASNTSEYFMETDSVSTKEVKITTTPLLEYIKLKRQQKIDIRNENRLRKKEVEREKRRKDEEMRREKIRKDREKLKAKEEPKEESPKVVDADVAKPEEKKQSDHKATRNLEKEEKRTRSSRRAENSEVHAKSKVVAAKPKDVKEEKALSKEEKPSGKTVEAKKDIPRVEAKSKFRYSEQRNRDRGTRSSKPSDTKPSEPAIDTTKDEDCKKIEERKESSMSRQSTQDTSDGSPDDEAKDGRGKDPRTERKIRNKDRPTMQIYQPGMGKFSKQRIEPKKEDAESADVKVPVKPAIKDEDIRSFRNRKIIDNADLKASKKMSIEKSEASASKEGDASTSDTKNMDRESEVVSPPAFRVKKSVVGSLEKTGDQRATKPEEDKTETGNTESKTEEISTYNPTFENGESCLDKPEKPSSEIEIKPDEKEQDCGESEVKENVNANQTSDSCSNTESCQKPEETHEKNDQCVEEATVGNTEVSEKE